MAQTVRRFPQLTLNTDGNAHPRENSLVVATLILGLVAFFSSFFHSLHMLASWTGLFGILSGVVGLFYSVTTAERFVVIIGTGAAAIGFYLGVAFGGLWGA